MKRISAKRKSISVMASQSGAEQYLTTDVSPSGYVCTGRFATDFIHVCHERALPYVPDVVHRPLTPCKAEALAQRKTKERVLSPKGKRGKVTKKESVSHSSASGGPKRLSFGFPEPINSQAYLRVTTPPPRTYVTKDNLDYRRPRIQVDLDVADDERTVTEIHIRDWKLDADMTSALTQCFPSITFLHSLHLWNTGLNQDSLALLVTCLPTCLRLTTLVLDNNPLENVPVSGLVAPGSILENLSLRWCGLNDDHVQGMVLTMGCPMVCDSSLLSLNLGWNKITDLGLGFLAEALKTNRSLVSLNLASNQIGDAGVVKLAQALSWFPVVGQLLEARKKLIHAEVNKHMSVDVVPRSYKYNGRGSRANTGLKAGGKTPTLDKEKEKDKDKDKEKSKALLVPGTEKDKKRDGSHTVQRRPSMRKKSSHQIERFPSKLVLEIHKPMTSTRPRIKPSWHTPATLEILSYGFHPLLQAGYIHEGLVWLPGNQTLSSVNLARNHIREKGLQALLEAVQDQIVPADLGGGRGLRRLVVEKNAFKEDCEVARRLRARMSLKDPQFKSVRICLDKPLICPCALPVAALV